MPVSSLSEPEVSSSVCPKKNFCRVTRVSYALAELLSWSHVRGLSTLNKPKRHRRAPVQESGSQRRREMFIATLEGLAIAIGFAFFAPAVLLLGLLTYGYIAGHTGIEFAWNMWGGFADPVGRFGTALVFCVAVLVRYRKRRRAQPAKKIR